MTRSCRIKLESPAPQGTIRFQSGPVALAETARRTWVTVTRAGQFNDPRYGDFSIDPAMLLAMVNNFQSRTYGQDIFIDVAHDPAGGAAGKINQLRVSDGRLLAEVEWTEYGVEAIKRRGFSYLSAEYHPNWKDNETGQAHGPVLLGAGLTIRPVIKRLDPIRLAEPPNIPYLLDDSLKTALQQEARTAMNEHLKKLRKQLEGLKLSEAVITQLLNSFETSAKALGDDDAALKSLAENFATTGKTLAESLQPGEERPLLVTVPPVQLQQGMTADEVKRLLQEDREAVAADSRRLAEQEAANRRFFLDAIEASELDPTVKTQLSENAAVITSEMNEAQIKQLAAQQIRLAEQASVQAQLAQRGYRVQGSPRITVDESNTVRELQEIVDRRTGTSALSDGQRFAQTGGQLQQANRLLAEQALARFDRDNARQLFAEHRALKLAENGQPGSMQLAAGDGLTGDVSVPSIWRRSVLREALYRVVGLQFVDSGVADGFAETYTIPYSYRDTTAAGVADVRTYEAQAIKESGVVQTFDTAYNIPQKLAFAVSDELIRLANGDLLNWEVIAENTRNAQRILAEDTEQLIFNELLNASDEYGAVAVADEDLELQADDTDRVFVLANFPVVRPRKVFALNGNQVGSTLNPVTVTYDSVARAPYDGTGTQAAGIYYVLNYNLGEIYLVDQAGAIQTPANGTAFTISYSRVTNTVTFDTDNGSTAIDEYWDDFLYKFGLRKSLIEDTRSYMADFSLLSGTLMNQVERAKGFNYLTSRPGTDLQVNGNLGRIKDVRGYKAYAPGLNMGDIRAVIGGSLAGEGRSTKFRLSNPWEMGPLENKKDGSGNFVGKKHGYGTQHVVCHTPMPLKGAYTSISLFSTTGRVARVSP